MTCAEVQDLIGPMLDGSVAAQTKSIFFDHIGSCGRCGRAYDLEYLAKILVQSNAPRVETPAGVRASILRALTAERLQAGVGVRARGWFTRVPAPAYAAVLGAILLAYLVFPLPPSSEDLLRHVGERDIMTQATSNLSLFQNGKLIPSMTSCSPESVYGYLLSQRVPFKVNVRPIEQCDAYSAIVNEYNGVKLAHVVYKLNKDLLYVYQVNKDETVGDDAHLSMPGAARLSLKNTGWYIDEQHPDFNVVLWEENGTICAAASTLSKDRMMAVLAVR